ncbi:GerAB/ArcD/ProY family transporter [Pseudobacteroides cellulosolvens]|uniref:Spore germination protein n=2 Tax=Pseudobacteroides cellulosolvens TaxID=35825 RepID=A0A0L6JJB2_9FIRM|nr:endospore germination permease [Pseudobacteroides cellulosolvens]KNY25825.1 spore germination protein [Pseudobacteroides cellulosolvens ATCC 35603 = DSM 2933]
MFKEQINDKEGICLSTLFIMGSSLIIGVGSGAKNDAWIAGIVGIFMSLPVIFLYSRILSLFPGKDLFDIINIAFGKVFGKVISLFYIWYAFHLGALVIRNFGEFINTVSLPETPMFVPMLFISVVCLYVARMGVEVIGRISTYFLPIVLFIIVAVNVLAIPQFDIRNIKPVLSQGFAPVIKGGFSAFAFPFAESVILLGVLFSLKTKKSPYKVYFTGILFAGIVIVFLTIRNIVILGELLGHLNFPSHVAVSRISVSEFLQRIEVSVAFVFVVCAFTKASVCLYVASKGIGKIFKLNDYRSVVIQTGLLMIFLSYTLYKNIMEMRYWAYNVYQYYAFPFQVILPLIIWIIIEFKAKKMKKV